MNLINMSLYAKEDVLMGILNIILGTRPVLDLINNKIGRGVNISGKVYTRF